MSEQFDCDKALAALQNGQDLTGKDGILTPLVKQLTEAALKAELASHIEDDEAINRKNGFSKTAIKSPSGSFALDTRYARRPERFVRGRPVVALPPNSVAINPITPGDYQPAADCVNFPTLTAAGYVK